MWKIRSCREKHENSKTFPFIIILCSPGSHHGIPEIDGQKHLQFVRKLKTGGQKLETYLPPSLTPAAVKDWSEVMGLMGAGGFVLTFDKKSRAGQCLEKSFYYVP